MQGDGKEDKARRGDQEVAGSQGNLGEKRNRYAFGNLKQHMHSQEIQTIFLLRTN